MRKESIPIIGAVITALLSTICCLPAFLFLFFGVSSGVLTYFTTFENTRVPLAILTIIFFIIAFKNLKKRVSCKCSTKEIYKQYFVFSSFFVLIISLLFYPEFIPYFMD